MSLIKGLHHITAVAADPQCNLDFYAGVLGLRLVKKTVNQDDPFTYHLYYGDALGRPGTAMTFFPFPGVPAGQPGRGQPLETRFAVPAESLPEWRARLTQAGVQVRSGSITEGTPSLHFTDPDGLPLALVGQGTTEGVPADADADIWQAPGLPAGMAIQRFAGMTLSSYRPDATAQVLTELLSYAEGAADTDGRWFRAPGEGTGDQLYLFNEAAPGQPGYGTVHHIAFRVADRSALLEMLERVQAIRLPSSGEVDRFYFKSVYFREPGGMLFEIATDDPGFAVDEPAESLGEALKLTDAHEPMRAAIEARLPVLQMFARPANL
ncbi:UNVERIFIED_CONTAM: ring-cleaving dioxygenase [Spiribacter pallidus]|jgi:glyoxalase family protein|uniref:ring-cleaving dioxygenase n=1 Tax=Spiribacter pallidus TaxID=1987936 RepID=UPI0034A04EFF